MRQLRRYIEKGIEALLRLSGATTTLIVVLISIFLFKEGMGLFNSPVVEKGYVLCLHQANPIEKLSSYQIKEIFDEEITNWAEVGGLTAPIQTFRFEQLFDYFTEEELGEDYSLLTQRLSELIEASPNMIAFLPEQYAPIHESTRILAEQSFSPSSFFLGKEWIPTSTPSPQFGILPLVLGTLLISITAILIALPLGLGVAIYLSQLASKRTRRLLKPVIELLAGIPSVVYGFFGLVVLVPIVQKGLKLPIGETAFTGSLLLAIMALPTIITVAEDSMSNTPRAMREASLALGATHWQTIYKVIIPYAKSGISAAVVLGIGRAIGETMAVLMVTGNAAVLPNTLFEPIRSIPATIAAELGEAPTGGAHYQSLFLLGCILFIITLIISVSAELISKKQLKN
ncbi:MAG: phosphate ABC transporter permease subunit PstC [Bacteroides sp.]